MPFTDQLTTRERTIGYDQTVTVSARYALTNGTVLFFASGPGTQVVPLDGIICPNLSIGISNRRDYSDHSEFDYYIGVVGDGSFPGGAKLLGTLSMPLASNWIPLDISATLNVHAEETCVEYLDTVTPYREVNKPGTVRGVVITCGGTTLFDSRQTIPAGGYNNTPNYYAPFFKDIAVESRNYELLDNTGSNPVWLSVGARITASVSHFGPGYCDAPDVGTFSSEAGESSLFLARSNPPPQWTHTETINKSGPVFGASFKDTGGSPSSVVTITGRVRNADQPSTTPHDLRLTVSDNVVVSLPVDVLGQASLTSTVGGWGMAFATYRNSTMQSGKTSQWDNSGTEFVAIRAANAAVSLQPNDPTRPFLRYLEQKDSVTVQQAASCPLFPAWNVTPNTPNRWVSQNTGAITLSVVSSPNGTALRLQTTTSSAGGAAGGFAVVNERFAPPLRLGYRWYNIRFRSVGTANVPITVNGWRLTTGADGVWVEVEKDVFDTFSSRSVVAGYTIPNSTISIPGNQTIEVESVIGVRKKESLFSITGAPSPVIGGNIHAFTDGWLSYVLPAITTTIKAFVDHINLSTASSGWSAVNLRPLASGDTDIWSDSQSVGLIESGGTDNTSKVYIDLPTPVTLRCRQLVRSGATLYPGCGDIWNITDHAYGFVTQLTLDLHTGAFLSATMRGNTGATVTAKIEATGEDRGSGSGNDQGFANIGAPYLYRTQANKSPTPTQPVQMIENSVSGSLPWQTINLVPVSGQSFYRIASPSVLARYWTIWDVPRLAISRLAIIRHDLFGWFGKAEIAADGKSITWQRTNGPYTSSSALLPAVTVKSGTGAETFTYPTLTIDPTGQDILRLRYERNDGSGNYSIYEQQSYDDGATWSTAAVAIANARQPSFGRELPHQIGMTIEAAWIPDSSGATVGVLKGAYRTASGLSTVVTFQKLVGSTLSNFRITDAGYAITQLPEGQGRWAVCCVLEGETDSSTWVSADENVGRLRVSLLD